MKRPSCGCAGKVYEYAKNGLPPRLLRSPRRTGVGGWTRAEPGPDRLKECILQLRKENDPEYRELLTEPSFLEDLAILIDCNAIGFEVVDKSLGSVIAYCWSLWEPTVVELRKLRRESLTFKEFENLAIEIGKANRPTVPMDAAETKIIWEGFRL